MIPDFSIELISHLPAFSIKMKNEYNEPCVKYLKGKPVSDWEINIYHHIREHSKHYDYTKIMNILNDLEIPTHSGKIGLWNWYMVRTIVRRVEDYLGIESQERLHVALNSNNYRIMLRDMCNSMKKVNPSITQQQMADQLNIHGWPRHYIDDLNSWNVRGITLLYNTNKPRKHNIIKHFEGDAYLYV